MSNLPGVLGDYVTVAMAVELLGHSREQTGRFYSLVRKGLPTYKIGGMTLAKFSELAELAGLPELASPPWPAKLASLEMKFLHSRNDAAEIVGVSPRTINRQANAGEISTVDLAPWGGYTLYQLGTTARHPGYIILGDWQISYELDERGRLIMTIVNNKLKAPFMLASMAHRPRMMFIHADELEPAKAIISVDGSA